MPISDGMQPLVFLSAGVAAYEHRKTPSRLVAITVRQRA